eukprot:scaffold20567_cov21-Tisochrysis_lutea.AAC.2
MPPVGNASLLGTTGQECRRWVGMQAPREGVACPGALRKCAIYFYFLKPDGRDARIFEPVRTLALHWIGFAKHSSPTITASNQVTSLFFPTQELRIEGSKVFFLENLLVFIKDSVKEKPILSGLRQREHSPQQKKEGTMSVGRGNSP